MNTQNNHYNDVISGIEGTDLQRKRENRKLTQQEYLGELLKSNFFTEHTIQPDLIEPLTYYINTFTDLLAERSDELRISQIKAIEAIIEHIRKGKLKGLIKLPTGAGKTRLFTEVIAALDMPSVVLIPRTSLKGQTVDGFIDHEVIDNKRVFLIGDKKSKYKTAAEELNAALNIIEKENISNPIILITYQSLLSVKRTDPEVFDRFRRLIQCIIRDEAHRSLGDETSVVLEQLKQLDEGFDESDKKLELLLTATPKLLAKDIRETYETIIHIRTQDVIEQGDLIMPKRVTVGNAYLRADTDSITENFLQKNASKFVDAKGVPVYKNVIAAYKKERAKQPNNYLPFVAFCADIQHAEFIKGELEKEGIRAHRVTSSNQNYDKGVGEDEAKIMLLSNDTDGVTTVSKVGEGWDVPTLRCALQFCPIRSEAKYMQGVGRIMRILLEYLINKAAGMTPKDSENTMIIEPSLWYIRSQDQKENTATQSEGSGDSSEEESYEGLLEEKEMVKLSKTKISGLGHFLNSGEFDESFLTEHYGNLESYLEGYPIQDNYFVEVNGEERLAIAQTQEYTFPNGLKIVGRRLRDRILDSQSEEWLYLYRKATSGIQASGGVKLDICNYEELCKIVPYSLDDNLTTFIDGRKWIAVSQQAPHILPCSVFKARKVLEQLHTTTPQWLVENRKQERGMTGQGTHDIYDYEKLMEVLPQETTAHILNEEGEIIIEDMLYKAIFVRKIYEDLGSPTGATVISFLQEYKQTNPEWFVKNCIIDGGLTIGKRMNNIYNREELKKLFSSRAEARQLNEEGLCEIDGKKYTLIVNRMGSRTPLRCSGFSALRFLEKYKKTNPDRFIQNCKIKGGKLFNSGFTDLYDLEEVLKILPITLDEDSSTIINDEVWTAVTQLTTPENSRLPVRGKVMKNRLAKQKAKDAKRFETNCLPNKGEGNLDLYRLSELLKLT